MARKLSTKLHSVDVRSCCGSGVSETVTAADASGDCASEVEAHAAGFSIIERTMGWAHVYHFLDVLISP